MSTDKELEERRQRAREQFLSRLRTVGITGNEATDLADSIQEKVSEAVQDLIDRKS